MPDENGSFVDDKIVDVHEQAPILRRSRAGRVIRSAPLREEPDRHVGPVASVARSASAAAPRKERP